MVAERVEPVARAAGAVDRRGRWLRRLRPRQHPRQPDPQGQHADGRRLRRPRVGTGLPAGPHPPALAALRLGPGLVRRVPHVQVLHGGAGPGHGAARRRPALRRGPQDGQRAGAGRPAGVLLGLRQARRPALPDPAAVRHRVDLLPLRLVVHDLRRQRGVDHGGGVLLQPRPVHVDAVPRRARPGHADREGARPRGGALRAHGPVPPDRRHLRRRWPRCSCSSSGRTASAPATW